jgi:hypothetical protein
LQHIGIGDDPVGRQLPAEGLQQGRGHAEPSVDRCAVEPAGAVMRPAAAGGDVVVMAAMLRRMMGR